MRQLTITLADDLAELVHEPVATGEFGSDSEVVGEAIVAWLRNRAGGHAALRDEIRHGLDSGPPTAASEVFAELHARYAAA